MRSLVTKDAPSASKKTRSYSFTSLPILHRFTFHYPFLCVQNYPCYSFHKQNPLANQRRLTISQQKYCNQYLILPNNYRPVNSPVLPGDSRFCLLSSGLLVFYNFSLCFLVFQQRFSYNRNDRNVILRDKVLC